MNKIIRRIDLTQVAGPNDRQILHREWLVTNGLGGYASGTICGIVTRRYHGLLIAALPAPLGRVVMLNHLAEHVRFPDGSSLQIGGEEPGGQEQNPNPCHALTEFRLENGLPIWRYEAGDVVLEKHVLFLYGQNTVHINYHLISHQQQVHLELRPSIHFRRHDQPVNEEDQAKYQLSVTDGQFEISGGGASPCLRLAMKADQTLFSYNGGSRREIYYPREAERGYPSRGNLWSPGHFSVVLRPNRDATLIGSTESTHIMLALSPQDALRYYHERCERLIATAQSPARHSPGADLVLAADQFIITPAGRVLDSARAHAAGDEIRTVIAGYHWFTDWGRDTMISLEGLTLTTRRYTEAAWVLRTFAHYIRDGLIPNLFPEGQNEGLYHTADATLWFFHALARYFNATGDRSTLRLILPKLVDIVEAHLRGTRFGIGVDADDGLLRQGAQGYPLTWMDAKVQDWVVTPRRGKAVEINALWYNALRLLEGWLRQEQGDAPADRISEQASRTRDSFNQRFWYVEGNYLYDIVDGEQGDDNACRPNQVLAMSLIHPVLESSRWASVLNVVRERLLTPVGLRTLSPDHRDYKARYFGDLRARDAAYHQGTVWAWLIGPFVDAWLKFYPADRSGARRIVEALMPHLDDACIGSINEVFDAEQPFTPRGCIAQAWSVAEALRCWVLTAEPEQETKAAHARERVAGTL